MTHSSFTHTKKLIALAAIIACAPVVRAQEAIDLGEAQTAARKLNESASRITDAPFTVECDLEKPQGIKHEGVGLLVLPDRKLSTEPLAAANTAITPLGQLWMLKLAVAAQGKPVATEKIRHFSITDDEKTHEVSLYFLGATKTETGGLELVVYAKDKEPLLRVPIKKRVAGKQEFPIEVSGVKNDDNTGTLSLRLFGEYDAQLPLMHEE